MTKPPSFCFGAKSSYKGLGLDLRVSFQSRQTQSSYFVALSSAGILRPARSSQRVRAKPQRLPPELGSETQILFPE